MIRVLVGGRTTGSFAIEHFVFRTDLLVVGRRALVYGSTEQAAMTIQHALYATCSRRAFVTTTACSLSSSPVLSLLQYRAAVPGLAALPVRPLSLNTIRLDVMELTEKVDNAIKFLSDMFYARLYGLAAAKSEYQTIGGW